MTDKTTGNRKPSPFPRAVLAGLIAGIAAGLISYAVVGLLGLIIGFIAGAIVGSRTVLLMHKAREQDQ
jgi:predicted lipid-binding transport protein (Tim44 family)